MEGVVCWEASQASNVWTMMSEYIFDGRWVCDLDLDISVGFKSIFCSVLVDGEDIIVSVPWKGGYLTCLIEIVAPQQRQRRTFILSRYLSLSQRTFLRSVGD